MGGKEAKGVAASSGAEPQIPRGGIGAWLLWLNAILEVAYSTADVDTGC